MEVNRSRLRVLVVEDEPLFALQLEAMLTDLGYTVLGPLADADAALNRYRAALPLPDVALLDIRLGRHSPDGIALAAQLLAERPLPLIFLTSQSDTASFERARQVGPAAYLVKPVEPAALQRAIELAVANFAAPSPQALPDDGHADGSPFASADMGVLLPDALFVKEDGLLVKVLLTDVSWLMAEDKFCRIALRAGRTVLVRQPLRDISQHLPAEQFVQIQRSYFVNASCIERLDPVRSIVQVAGQLLPMGKAYRDSLLERLRLV